MNAKDLEYDIFKIDFSLKDEPILLELDLDNRDITNIQKLNKVIISSNLVSQFVKERITAHQSKDIEQKDNVLREIIDKKGASQFLNA
jgi:hypothetical protein